MNNWLSQNDLVLSHSAPPAVNNAENYVENYARSGDASSLLLNQRKDLFSVDDQGDNHLHLAVIHEQQKSLESLLQAMSKFPKPMYEALNARNTMGQTPLHIAAYTGQPEALSVLLHAKADFRKADRKGNTIIHVACLRPHQEGAQILQLLANFVEEKNQALLTQYLAAVANKRNFDGKTALHLAVENNDAASVDVLERMGVDPDKGDRNSGSTALHYAVQMQKTDMVRRLLYQMHASPNVEAFDNATPLHVAVETRNLRLIEMLMDLGADPAIERSQPDADTHGRSCFDMADGEEMQQILRGELPTLYRDLSGSLEMYEKSDKAMYLGIGAQKKLVEFLSAKIADESFLASETWGKFMSALGLDQKLCRKQEQQHLFFSGGRMNQF